MRSISAAFFLACSWFWCIGGFFPVLLEQEFGATALPFFILFNVTGAALFGLVWTNAGRVRFLAKFRLPAEIFSVVVSGYHLVFMTWLSVLLQDPMPVIGFAACTALFVVLRSRLSGLAPAVLVITAALFAVAVLNAPTSDTPAQATAPFAHQILPLALGFLLAPCFDLTFHRAFADSPNPRLSFLLGFGVLFAALLGGMVLAGPVFAMLLSSNALSGSGLQAVVAILMLQTAYTSAAHMRELGGTRWANPGLALPAAGAAVIVALLHVAGGVIRPEFVLPGGELAYRSFVFVIGGLFPVVLLFGGINRPSLIAAAFITPCYTLGFLIGGDWAPFLSVAMAGLAVMVWLRRKPIPLRPYRARRSGP